MSTGTRGSDNIPFGILKNLDRVFRNRVRILAEAGVELRLSTAGLLAGEVHADAEALENVHDGLTSLREERIGQAGDEELDLSHKSILIPFRILYSAFCLPRFPNPDSSFLRYHSALWNS